MLTSHYKYWVHASSWYLPLYTQMLLWVWQSRVIWLVTQFFKTACFTSWLAWMLINCTLVVVKWGILYGVRCPTELAVDVQLYPASLLDNEPSGGGQVWPKAPQQEFDRLNRTVRHPERAPGAQEQGTAVMVHLHLMEGRGIVLI